MRYLNLLGFECQLDKGGKKTKQTKKNQLCSHMAVVNSAGLKQRERETPFLKRGKCFLTGRREKDPIRLPLGGDILYCIGGGFRTTGKNPKQAV